MTIPLWAWYRTGAAQFDFEMQFFVGGPRAWANLASILAGGAYDATASTTTTDDVVATSTEIPVVSTAGFTTGVAVIAPNGTGEVYEVFQYGSADADSFNDLTRDWGEGWNAGW